jgi:hypothetical protein
MANGTLFFLSSSVFTLFFVALHPRVQPTYLMPLKYQKEIEALSPTKEDWLDYHQEDNKQSFRWVFEDIKDARNFTPRYGFPAVYRMEEGRRSLKFTGWSISFFDSLDNARRRLKHFCEDKPEMQKRLGTHLAQGIVNSTDGLTQIKCDKHGHFNHFEFKATNFYDVGKFEVVEKLYQEQ